MSRMDGATTALLHQARTPAEAQGRGAMLRGAGSGARVRDDLRAAEFAVSQRLMNQVGVRILVPTAQLDDARAILAESRSIGDDELTAQAVAATGAEASESERPPAPATSAKGATLAAVAAALLALLFFCLWMDTRQRLRESFDPLVAWKATSTGLRGFSRATGKMLRELVDRNDNRVYEEQRYFDAAGNVARVAYDDDEDGTLDRLEEHSDGLVVLWSKP